MVNVTLKDKMKDGISLSEMAKILDISRPKIYRHMDYYMSGDMGKVDHNLKEYFDKIIDGSLDSEDAMRKELNRISDYMKAEKEVKVEELRKDYGEYSQKRTDFDIRRETMKTEERIREEEALDETYRRLSERAKSLDKDLDELLYGDEEERVELTWNEGEIRSACVWGYRSCMVVIDADFDKCRDITLELIMKISGREFVIKRQKPEENERFVRVDIRDMPIVTSYRLKWNDKDQVKYTPVYPMGYARGPF